MKTITLLNAQPVEKGHTGGRDYERWYIDGIYLLIPPTKNTDINDHEDGSCDVTFEADAIEVDTPHGNPIDAVIEKTERIMKVLELRKGINFLTLQAHDGGVETENRMRDVREKILKSLDEILDTYLRASALPG